ncbi:hypothetical protein AB0J80_23665 [Actinoplanes sp. NPDC049548]|uniref:hypothetical protein n=1 Tax=Actinoplanes sp. NPDC049548 TaxID=3155152 RepID=UPI00342273AB
MNKRMLSAVIIPAVAFGAMVAPSAALAADGPVGHSGCFKSSASDSQKTYLEARNNSTKIRSRSNAVTVTAIGTGNAYDCGPAGHGKITPQIHVELQFRAEGKRLSCSGTVGGGVSGGKPDVSGSITCSGNREEMSVTLKHTCKKEEECRISVADETFSAASDGKITMLETRVIVTNGSSVRTSSYVRVI